MRRTEYAANNIGISGFKYIFGPEVSFLRRLIWLFAILMATSWMLWNIQGRVVYFLSRPSAITTEMKFKGKLMFPKITICNQNMFRSSRVFSETNIPRTSPTLYEAVDRYLQVLPDDNKHQSFRQKVIDRYEKLLREKHVKEFYRKVSHQKSTLIHSCTWKGERCGPENFTEVFTNMGICYQFSVDTEHMIVDKANKDGGLDVTLFVEQYDYMRGPQATAGALVLVTDHNETEAMAKEQGTGVTVGQSVSIGLEQSDNLDLPPPFGSCGSADMDSYSPDEPYTYQKCHLNCLTSFIKSKCGCINIYMPGNTSDYCTLFENLNCVKQYEELFYRRNQINTCNCPSPCQSTNYVYSVSLVQFSDSFKQSLSLDDHSVSLATVNRAVAIQAWGLLNRMNTSITDDLAELGIMMNEMKKRWTGLYSSTIDFIEKVKILKTFVSGNNLTAVAISHEEMANAAHSLYRIEQIFRYYHRTLSQDLFWLIKDFLQNIDHNLAASVLSNQNSDRWVVSKSNNIEAATYTYHINHNIILNFTKTAFELLEYQNISVETVFEMTVNESTLTTDLQYLMYDMDTFSKTIREKAIKVHYLYKKEMALVHAVGKHKYAEATPTFYSENLLKLEIYFKNLGVLESKKSPAYSPEGLVCDIGGSIGLCLGGSILTLVEIFDILAILFRSRKKIPESEKKTEDMMQ